MSKSETIKGTIKTLAWLVGEEWKYMDHKLVKIIASAVTFVLMGLFWFFVLRNIMPF